jgi:acyl-CoA synthetase (AMP-forming)/AMP-acid ligase II
MAKADSKNSTSSTTSIKQHLIRIHALKHNAEHHPDHLFRWVNADCEVSDTLSYHRLWEQAGLVARLLERNEVQKGDRVMIAYPFGFEFLSGLFGCMKPGVIACSVSI